MIIDHHRLLWALLVPALVAAFSLAAAVLVSVRVDAHDWYPVECCHSMDCAPVESYSYVAGAAFDSLGKPITNPLPQLVVTTRMGTAVVPDGLSRRESKDNRMHACLRKVWALGSDYMEVRCIFMPPAF